MRPIWRRVGNVIIVVGGGREYRFHWTDADVASAIYSSLRAEYRTNGAPEMETEEE